MTEPKSLAYFALDVPHKGQASHTHINEIVSNLRKLGWHVDLFAPEPSADGRAAGVFVRIARYARAIMRIVRKMRSYQVLYVRAHPFAWPVTFWGRRVRRVVVQEINGTELDIVVSYPWLRPLRWFFWWTYVWQYRASQHLFPVTEKLAEWLVPIAGRDRIDMVTNAANTDHFRPLANPCSKPFVVFCGSLTRWYGVDTMIDALRDPVWPVGIKLRIVGIGAQASLVQAALDEELPIEWLGYQPYQSVPDLISGAWAGLIPATNPQGRASNGVMPLKLFETLACGVAAVVTDLPGQADLVRAHQCGLVVAPGDATALAYAVRMLVSNEAETRAMGKRGAELVRNSHSWAARARGIDRVLKRYLAERDV